MPNVLNEIFTKKDFSEIELELILSKFKLKEFQKKRFFA